MSAINWSEINAKLPYGRTTEEKERRKKLFKELDPNGNGHLSLAEVDKAMRDVLKIDELFDAKPAIKAAYNAAKGKGGGNKDYIQFREFRFFLESLRQYFEYYVIFERFDENNDGTITLVEFVKAQDKIKASTNLNIEDPEATFKELDKNDGAKILFDEFFTWAIKNNLDLNDDED